MSSYGGPPTPAPTTASPTPTTTASPTPTTTASPTPTTTASPTPTTTASPTPTTTASPTPTTTASPPLQLPPETPPVEDRYNMGYSNSDEVVDTTTSYVKGYIDYILSEGTITVIESKL